MSVMKLKHVQNIFHKKDLIVKQKQEQKDFAILESHLPDIFVTEDKDSDLVNACLDFTVASIRRDDDRPNHIYQEEFLPYHTGDDVWLTKYIHKQKYSSEESTQQPKDLIGKIKASLTKKRIKKPTILKFVKTNQKFKVARNRYETGLARAQVDYMTYNDEPNEVLKHHKYELNDIHTVDVLYNPKDERTKTPFDKEAFLQSAYIGLTKNLGLNPHNVEVGLRDYALKDDKEI